MTFRTRFAPSPTGPLHLGHAYSALIAARAAQAQGGAFLLRIEDIDQSRSRSHWEDQIYDDLTWMGLAWPTPVMRQSDRSEAYQAAVGRLTDMGLTYPCVCRRSDIEAAAGAPQEGVPQFGPDGRIYPGTCRQRTFPESSDHVVRLNMAKALDQVDDLSFNEVGPLFTGTHNLDKAAMLREVGDIILVRRGMAASYHLAVVVDDADQAITQVTRGADLWEATQIHVVLQKLLGVSTPVYHHHDLIRDDAGKRLAKRDDARAIATYRAEGATPMDILKMLGLSR
ncbi:tRNA glutamyl-Q(34) synthetase GluQRS [Cognatishimia sp.]|uniref:tRNA glutamyl-Q(34) synthetase GluQRS n=1 Tax=Cognatishimia sp. TaxID=2211648 RepID=UPI0035126A1C